MRLVIGEDEALFREGLRALMTELGYTVEAVTADARELPGLVAEHRPDVLVTDIRMPPLLRDDGLRAALQIRRTTPTQAVLVLSQQVQRRYALSLFGTGLAGIGYLLKQRVADVRRFREDLETVARGGHVLDPEVAAAAPPIDDDPGLRALTPRQLQVLELIAEGRSNAAIAAALGVSERAVKLHVANVYEALAIPGHQDDHRRVLAALRFLSR